MVLGMRLLFLTLHIFCVVICVGGMFFAHFCLRPEAAIHLPPAQRLPLLTGVLRRFFNIVAIVVLILLGSGVGIMVTAGLSQAPLHWYLMGGAGILMACIFAYIYQLLYPRLESMVRIQDWPNAGGAMNRIRIFVTANLAIGLLTIMVATLGPLLER
jgi:uncharacterized membrane protein